MTNYIVKKINKTDWLKYKEIRLEALKNEPSAFGSSYDDISSRTDSEWQDLFIKKEDDGLFYYSVLFDNEFIAIGGAFKDKNGEWNVIAIYTRNKFRGLGVGTILMKGIVAEFEKRGIQKIYLRVNTSQVAAISLYNKLGFKIIKTVNNQLLGDGKLYNEFEMICEL